MAISTALSKTSAQPSTKQDQEFEWDAQYVIDTLPTWRCQALKAKQSQNYILNAYNYWLALNKTEPLDVSEKLDKLIVLLAEDPDDFLLRVKALIY